MYNNKYKEDIDGIMIFPSKEEEIKVREIYGDMIAECKRFIDIASKYDDETDSYSTQAFNPYDNRKEK